MSVVAISRVRRLKRQRIQGMATSVVAISTDNKCDITNYVIQYPIMREPIVDLWQTAQS